MCFEFLIEFCFLIFFAVQQIKRRPIAHGKDDWDYREYGGEDCHGKDVDGEWDWEGMKYNYYSN